MFIDLSKQDSLIKEIDTAITEINQNASHKKSPNQLGFLRERLEKSLEIYKKYMKK